MMPKKKMRALLTALLAGLVIFSGQTVAAGAKPPMTNTNHPLPAEKTAIKESGHISMFPRNEVEVGSWVTLTFTYTAGPQGLRQGGGLRIRMPNDSWSEPLVPIYRSFVRAEYKKGKDDGIVSYSKRNVSAVVDTASGAGVRLTAERTGPYYYDVVATLMDGNLSEGDRIVVVLGDTTWGERGIQVQRVHVTRSKGFSALVDVEGTDSWQELDAAELQLPVAAGPVSRWNVVVPACVRPGETFPLHLAGTDAYNNRARSFFTGKLRLLPTEPSLALPGSAAIDEKCNNTVTISPVMATEEGVYRVCAEPENGSERNRSNPVWCTRENLRIWFGDLHTHSIYHAGGFSVGTPRELCEYARDVAGLDFIALSDSGAWKGKGWQENQRMVREFSKDGSFIAFKAFEYGSDQGHRNVIYRNCDAEDSLPLNLGTPEQLFEFFRGRNDVLAIPHHPKVWTDWNSFDPALEPVVEVYSCWGSSVEHQDPLWKKGEKPGAGVFSGLKRGLRFGFIGSGDSHSGTPGRSYPSDENFPTSGKSGFACVYAPELTREAVFDALRARRCYATTGIRSIVYFTINEVFMGGEVTTDDPSRPRSLNLHIIGTDKLKTLRIIKNNQEWLRRELDGEELFFDIKDTSQACTGDFYYIHVTQEDGNAMWSSPVWIDVKQ